MSQIESPVVPVTEVTVDDAGISARSRQEAVLDLLVDDRRIFSFWLQRDGEKAGRHWQVAWPRTLREFLDGTGEVAVVVHETGEEVFRGQVRLGNGEGALEFVHARTGQPISLDKSWRRVTTFDTRSEENIAPLMDAIDTVLQALREVGLEAFLAYGTLLGAVREGQLLGHDSDADLGYVSRHSHPVDAIRESFLVQRKLIDLGFTITRYSALAFKVDVEEGDGVVRGLDVFGGFMMDGWLYLMGEVRERFEESWIFPLGTTTLEGRTFAAPADPDKLLSAMYGPHWRTPDPAFKFSTPDSTHRRLNGWFRGLRVGRARWDRIYSRVLRGIPEPSPFVRWVAEQEPDLATYVDVGCGRGADVLFMAEAGVASYGLDFQPRSFAKAAQQAPDNATFWTTNLLELRQVLAAGAILSRTPGPRAVVARHLVDTMKRPARTQLFRLSRMTLAGGHGRLYLEFLLHAGEDGYAGQQRVRRRKGIRMVRELEAAGARILERHDVPVSSAPGASVLCRIVADWPAHEGAEERTTDG
jgi:hypothetical protein